jgi:hypothetical protein
VGVQLDINRVGVQLDSNRVGVQLDSSSPETIKKSLKRKAVKNLQEQNTPSEAYDYEPTITNILIEREMVKLASIAYLVKAVKDTHKSVKELHQKLKSNPSKNQAVLAKIRKFKSTGSDTELLQIIAGVLGYQLGGKIQDVNIKKASR